MAVPWFRLLDAALGIHDLVRLRRSRPADDEFESRQLTRGSALQGVESRLANVVVAALRETFDRDSRRLELERQRLDMERERAERALQLEFARQSVDREITRLRFVAAMSTTIVIVTFFVVQRLGGPAGGSWIPRATLGAGWVFLFASIWRSMTAQSVLAGALDRMATDNDLIGELDERKPDPLPPALLVAGLVLASIAVLIA